MISKCTSKTEGFCSTSNVLVPVLILVTPFSSVCDTFSFSLMITSKAPLATLTDCLRASSRFCLRTTKVWVLLVSLLVLQKVASEDDPKVRNHGEGPY